MGTPRDIDWDRVDVTDFDYFRCIDGMLHEPPPEIMKWVQSIPGCHEMAQEAADAMNIGRNVRRYDRPDGYRSPDEIVEAFLAEHDVPAASIPPYTMLSTYIHWLAKQTPWHWGVTDPARERFCSVCASRSYSRMEAGVKPVSDFTRFRWKCDRHVPGLKEGFDE